MVCHDMQCLLPALISTPLSLTAIVVYLLVCVCVGGGSFGTDVHTCSYTSIIYVSYTCVLGS